MTKKKVIFICIIGLILLIGYQIYKNITFLNRDITSINQVEISPTPETEEISTQDVVGKVINYMGVNYRYLAILSVNPENIYLIPNYKQKLKSNELMQENECIGGINGGFYGTNDEPIGWLLVEGKLLNEAKDSQLFNGYILLDNKGKLYISQSMKKGDIKYGLQTGPMLINNKIPEVLNMAEDRLSRRSVMVEEIGGKVSFISVFNDQNYESGPTLGDLGGIIKEIANLEKIDINNAINLDGGRASAIYTKTDNITETEHVGSWWCIKEE